jgi:hypothetical protein
MPTIVIPSQVRHTPTRHFRESFNVLASTTAGADIQWSAARPLFWALQSPPFRYDSAKWPHRTLHGRGSEWTRSWSGRKGVKRRILLGLVTLVAESAANAGTTVLDSGKWPMQEGKFLSGTAVVFLRVAWDGTPVQGCLAQSTGNSSLDESALRTAGGMHVAAPPGSGLPHPFNANLPLQLDAGRPASETIVVSPGPKHACDPVDLPAYGPAMRRRAYEAAHIIEVSPGQDGLVPDTNAAWPRDRDGRLIKAEVQITAIVKGGHLDDASRTFTPETNTPREGPFIVAAIRKTEKLPFDAASDPDHIGQINVRFNLPATLDEKRITAYPRNSPASNESYRLQACAFLANTASAISNDRRNGLSQADATARAKASGHGLLPEMTEKVAGLIYQFNGHMTQDLDQLNRFRTMLYCTAVLGPPGG